MKINKTIRRDIVVAISEIPSTGTTWTLPINMAISSIHVISDTDGATVTLSNTALSLSEVITCTAKDTRYPSTTSLETLPVGEWVLSIDTSEGLATVVIEYSNYRGLPLSREFERAS